MTQTLATLTEPKYYLATSAAQGIMSGSAAISVDGKWGRYTQAAYDKSPADIQEAVRRVVRALADSRVEDLKAYRDSQRSIGSSMIATSQSTKSIRDLIIALSLKEGVPAETALKIAFLESRLNPKATSPTGAKGIFQLTGVAIRDVRERGGGFVVSDPYDPEQNVTGGLRYLKIVARDLGVSLTETAKIYMGFNIGPSGAKHVLAGRPELAAAQIRLQAYGAPSQYAVTLTRAVNNAQA